MKGQAAKAGDEDEDWIPKKNESGKGEKASSASASPDDADKAVATLDGILKETADEVEGENKGEDGEQTKKSAKSAWTGLAMTS